MPGTSREYMGVATIGTASIYQVTGVPAFQAAQGSLAMRTDVAEVYQNTNGGSTWGLVGGGGSGLPFVATNEYYIDNSATDDPTNRIYDSIVTALDAADTELPAETAVVIRLREGQEHVWDMDGDAADGQRNITFYSHNFVNNATGSEAVLVMQNQLASASGYSPTMMSFQNLIISKSVDSFEMAAPRNFEFRGCAFQDGMEMLISSSEDDEIEIFFTLCTFLEEDGLFAGRFPLLLILEDGDMDSRVVMDKCRIDLTEQGAVTTQSMVRMNADAANRSVEYIDCTLEIFGADQGGGTLGAIGAPWECTGSLASPVASVSFLNTNLRVYVGVAGELFNQGSGVIEVEWNNATLGVQCIDALNDYSELYIGFRTDVGLNDLTILRSEISQSGGDLGSLPNDAPIGTIAFAQVQASEAQQRDVIWRMNSVDPTSPRLFWAGPNQTNYWSAQTEEADPTVRASMILQDLNHVPVTVEDDGQYQVVVTATANETTNAGEAILQLYALVRVVSGTISVADSVLEVKIDSSAGELTVAATADNVQDGIGITVSQGTELGFYDWFITSSVQRVA